LFLLVLCLTGLPLIFHAEIDRALSPIDAAHAQPGRTGTVDRAVARALAAQPRAVPQSLAWPGDGTIVLRTAPAALASPLVYRAVALDPADGRMLGTPPSGPGPTYILLALHRELLMGLPGMLFLGVMALAFLAAIASGVMVYAPFARREGFAAVRTSRSRRAAWLDIHNLLGIVLAAWLLIVGTTGAINTLADPMFASWRRTSMPPAPTPQSIAALPSHLASVDLAVANATRALPGMTPESMAFPTSLFGSGHHYVLWMRGGTPLTDRLLNVVLIDVRTGAVEGVRRLPWWLRLLEISRPLHFGDYGGLPFKVLWTLLDLAAIMVLGSGLYLWFTRRRRQARAPSPELPPA